jgi:hypothetical protein
MIFSVDERNSILDHLYGVGAQKPLGYLPINTVERHLGENIDDLKSVIREKGLEFRVFLPDECCINSGAVYVFDSVALQDILDGDRPTLESGGWPCIAGEFVDHVAKFWLKQDHPIHQVIARAFGERRVLRSETEPNGREVSDGR